MSSEENTFRSGLRLELPYLVDALGKDHGFLHDSRQFQYLAEIVADHHRHGAFPLFSFLVAGCDRGLDAYSLCITLLEEAAQHSGLDFPFWPRISCLPTWPRPSAECMRRQPSAPCPNP